MTYIKDKHKQYELVRYHKKRQKAIEILGGKCVNCGSTESLEIDHINPDEKEFNISKIWSLSDKRFLKELQKCQLLCHSCHDEKTYGIMRKNRKHGTWAMYRRARCKCNICKEFFNNYRQNWRLKTGRTKSPRDK